ncbi:hypothetical protein [Nocardia sp. NPDC020380]|uniref:hypothetical protein n=1 Tax=Nocardia sp. NPDC020380 TaxID=3364309 RepID=UPI003793A83E
MTITGDVRSAARLVAFGMRPKQIPARDAVYAELVSRYRDDDEFRALVHSVASGLGLVVLAVSQMTGTVLAAQEDSVFEIKMDEYARRTAIGARRSAEKVIHGLIHMAVAALAFPRSDDLANDSYVGRVAVEQVDSVVREACRLLDERAKEAESNDDPLDDAPDLERAWRVYARKPETAATKDGRLAPDTTRAMITKAMKFLADQGFLLVVSNETGGLYRTTPRYQVQVRELGAVRAFDELLALGVVAVPGATSSLHFSAAADPGGTERV